MTAILNGDFRSREGPDIAEDEGEEGDDDDDGKPAAERLPLTAASTPKPAINSRRENSDRMVLSPGSCSDAGSPRRAALIELKRLEPKCRLLLQQLLIRFPSD